MHEKLEELHDELIAVADLIDGGAADKRHLSVMAWSMPTLTFEQITRQIRALAHRLTTNSLDELNEEEQTVVSELITSVEQLKPTIIPHLFNGHFQTATPPLLMTISYISEVLGTLLGWRAPDPQSLPAPLAKKLQKTRRDLDNLMPDLAELESRLAAINEAYDAAESLPTTLQELRTARKEVSSISAASSELLGVIRSNDKNTQELTKRISAAADEATALAKQCAEAHQFTVTVGLAASFEDRAKELRLSLRYWVGALAVALAVGMGVGAWRLTEIGTLLSSDKMIDPSRMWVQILLSVLSVGAPVWFGWMSTKQIGQRFRLAEDYAFKASVAKAYEGYRTQAARIDPQLEKALFTSALARLDEEPLRFVEPSSHGSPLHELSNSKIANAVVSKAAGLVSKARASKRDAAPAKLE